ncbi:MAG: hypothetical protein UR28_C0006G0008 [Candidatus Peregrinibacteria bacterium GW2011_GWF2_33_10]|nr:MAG: hypothetical protein UR28_C0006G0008 [Candidatus Peregrinibacteria bacterium GW2011_GWF2_33_10]
MLRRPKWLKENEVVLKVYRHHNIPFILRIFTVTIVFSPFYFLVYIMNGAIASILPYGHILSVLIMINILIYIYTSLIYWFDKLVITSERVIHVDWITLTHKKINDIVLRDIKQINIENKGIIDDLISFLNYGTIEIEGTSTVDKITFLEAPKPYKIKCWISKILPTPDRQSN